MIPGTKGWSPRVGVLLALLLGGFVPAEGRTLSLAQPMAGAPDTVATVEVSAQGEVEVDPDRTRIAFAVETAASTAEEAAGENARIMERVHEALRALDDGSLRIETFGYAVRPRYRRPDPERREPPEIAGYRALNQVRVTVDRTEALGTLIDAAIGAGANRISGLEFVVSESEEARDEALRRAVARARRKAETAAEALGLSLGPVLAVRTDAPDPGAVRYRPVRLEAARAAAGPPPLEPETQTVTASVSIRYRLVEAPR